MHTEKENVICSLEEIEAMIIIFTFSLSLPLSLFFFYRGKKRKKIVCIELFYWCILRVERTVCCNQQTNIIISRVHIVHEKASEEKKKRNLTRSFLFFFIAPSFRMYSLHCLVDDILIYLK